MALWIRKQDDGSVQQLFLQSMETFGILGLEGAPAARRPVRWRPAGMERTGQRPVDRPASGRRSLPRSTA